ncbi:hypothetical protein [Ruminococcus sp.]|uniref:InlB B-repeat-containing protein n=1 Tax=Ruminococcus sp. TaxID=41978 RepID=UPI0038656301
MKNNFDRTKTATARFSTRAIAMVLFFVMLLTAIGSGSVLSAIAADFGTVSGDAIPAAATEGSDIALNAIPSEDAAVDNAVTKPDLSGFEENEIVRGIKKDFANTGSNNVELSSTGAVTYYLRGNIHGSDFWTNGWKVLSPAAGGTYYIGLDAYKNDQFKFYDSDGNWYGANGDSWDDYRVWNNREMTVNNPGHNFQIDDSNNYYYFCFNPTTNKAWISTTQPSLKTNYYLHYSSTDTGMKSTTGQLMSDSSDTWTYTINNYNSDAIYFNITTSSSAATNTTSVTGTPTCSDGVDAPTSGENGSYKYFRSGLQSKPQNLTFTFNSSTGALTVKGSMVIVQLTAGTSSDYQLRATDGSTMITNYGQTKTANYLTGKTVTITVTPQDSTKYVTGISCTGSGNSPSAVTDNGNGTYSATMTVKAAGTITAALAAKPTYTVSFSSSDESKGTVAARTSDGTILSSGDTVVKGTKVTFIATPKGNYAFGKWSGTFDSSIPTTTYTVNSAVTETATFGTKGYKLLAGRNVTQNMTELSNGTYISQALESDNWFEIVRNATGDRSQGNASPQELAVDGTKYDVTWTSGTGWSETGAYQKTTGTHYVVYDPATNKVWLTSDKDDLYGVTVIAKDGTIRYGYNPDPSTYYTSAIGDTTVELVTPTSITGTVDNNAYDGQAVAYNLTANDVREGVTLKIKTQVNDTYLAEGYYVKGFSVSGTEETYSVLWQEFNNDGSEKAEYDDKAWIDSGYNEFTLTISDYPEKGIEITPIYFIKETNSGDNVRFYVEGFAGEAYDDWGGTLAIDAYNLEGDRLFGEYPGQPMVNYNGRYFVDLPSTGVSGVTMNNYVWDRIHSNLFYGTSGTATGHEDTVKAVNYQTYDFNDFKYLKQSDAVKNHDEDIVFSFRYRKDSNYNTKATSQLGQSTYYINSTGVYGDDGWTSGEALDNNDYRKNFNVLDPDSPIYEWENFTDFYGNRVDIFGDYVDTKDSSGAATNPKAAYTNPIRIVSNGYDYDEAGNYATAWALYEPVDANGDSAYIGAYDHYQLFEVFGGQGLSNYGSSSYLVNPKWTENLRWKYDQAYRNAHSSETPKAAFVYDLADVPTVISYEYQVKDGFSNLKLEGGTGDGDPGYRSDGRWFVTSSDQVLTAHAIVEVAESQNSEFVRDYFQNGGIDYTSATGYDPAENTGIDTGIKAYFTNDDSDSAGTTTYTNTSGHTEAYSVSDGEHTFDLTTVPDSTGNYMFVGWYMYTNGKYSWLSNDLSYESEATANDVYVARYVKIPSGTLQISHMLDASSTGTGKCYVKAEILDGTNQQNVIYTYPEVESSTIKVEPKYIKSSSTYHLQITLRTVPDNFSEFEKFLEYLSGNAYEIVDLNGGQVQEKAYVDITTDNNVVTAKIRFIIKDLFDANGNQLIKSMPFTSVLKLPEYKYSIRYQYPAYNPTFGNQAYTVEDKFTPEELEEYMSIDNDHQLTMTSDPRKKQNFINSHAPYEDNFQQTISFNTSGINFSGYNKTTYTYTIWISCQNTTKDTVTPTFVFPYDVDASYVARETRGKIQATTPLEVVLPDRRIFEWIVTSGSTSQHDLDNDGEEPVFIKAPLIIYSDVDDESTAQYFKYWSVETEANYTSMKMASREFTRCYDPEFNLALFQNCKITPVYGPDSFESKGMATPVPNVYYNYERFDPEIQQKLDSTNGVTITFIENSRNQYNMGDFGDASGAAAAMADSREGAGDRVYSDFVLSYNNVAGGDLLRDIDDGKMCGLIIETVGDLRQEDGQYVVDTEATYKTTYGKNIDDIKSGLSKAELEAYIKGGARPAGCDKSEFSATALDNKNRIQYYYSLTNRNHKAGSATDKTMPEGEYNKNNHKVFRAYAYIRSADNTSVTISEVPVYFTINEIGSIALGAPANH